MKRIAVLIVLMAAVLVSGCTSGNPGGSTGTNSQAKDIDFSARVEVLAPSHYSVIRLDRAWYANMTKNIGQDVETRSVQFGSSEFAGLVGSIKTSDFFELESEYADMGIDNGTTYIVQVLLGNQSNEVLCYEACPDSVLNIVGRVSDVLDDEI